MTTQSNERQKHSPHAGSLFNRRFGLLLVGLLLLVALGFVSVRGWLLAPPALQSGDLLLLDPESIARVEAAAKAGSVLAQSTLGVACLEGTSQIPKNVTQAVYWLRKVTDRHRSEFDRIPRQMQTLLEQRQHEFDLRKLSAIEAKYFELFAQKLAFEAAFLGLIQVYEGNYGSAYANSELALAYLRRGATYGFPSIQRTLGIVTEFGLFGAPQDDVEGRMLLREAAANGDRLAQQLLLGARSNDRTTLDTTSRTSLSEGFFE